MYRLVDSIFHFISLIGTSIRTLILSGWWCRCIHTYTCVGSRFFPTQTCQLADIFPGKDLDQPCEANAETYQKKWQNFSESICTVASACEFIRRRLRTRSSPHDATFRPLTGDPPVVPKLAQGIPVSGHLIAVRGESGSVMFSIFRRLSVRRQPCPL